MTTYFARAVAGATALLLCLLLPGPLVQAQGVSFEQAVACGSGEGYYGWGPRTLVVDGQGNRYVAGTFNGTITLGSTTLTATQASAGNLFASDNFLAKLDAAGNYVWAVQLGDGQDATIAGLTVDAGGDVYVTGSFASYSVRFGAGGPVLYNSSAKSEGFVARLSGTTRQWAWARRIGGTGDDGLSTLLADASGDFFVLGRSSSPTATVGPFVLTEPQSFLGRLSASGTWRWVRQLGSRPVASQRPPAVSQLLADGQGHLYLAGQFTAPAVSFGPFTLTTQRVPGSPGDSYESYNELFVARIDTSGAWQWAVQADAVTHLNLLSLGSMSYDGLGHLYITGAYQSTAARIGSTVLPNLSGMIPPPVPLPAIPYTNNYFTDAFVARLSAATGAWDWAVRNGGTYQDVSGLIQADTQGRVYVDGSFDNPTVAGGGPNFAQLDGATGQWRSFQHLGPIPIYAMALDKQSRLHLGGYFSSPTAQFGSTTLAQAGPGRGTGYVARAGAGPLAVGSAQPSTPGMQVWPNPSGGGAVWVQGLAPGQRVEVLDVLGRVVGQGRMPASGPLALVGAASLAPGVYVVRAGQQAQRLVVGSN